MENPDKLRKNKISRLGMAGLTLAGTLATELPAEAAPRKVPQTQSQSVPAKNVEQSPVERLNRFTKGLHALNSLPATEVAQLEKTIEKGNIPLSLQINFLEQSLKAGNIHYRELMDPKLSLERFSKIIKIVDAVSARMTLAYRSKNAAFEIQKYFDIKNVVAATRTLYLQKTATKDSPTPGGLYSNGFLARSRADVYFATAAHGVKGTTAESEYTLGQNSADVAVKYIPREQLGVWGVNDPGDLPEISDATTVEGASGNVVVSYSFGPKDERGLQQQKIHFSFAMPFAPRARSLAYDTYDMNGVVVRIDDVLPGIKNTMMFLKPHDESLIKRIRPDGSEAIFAEGSSGSIVATFANGKYTVLGNLMGASVLADPCSKICYAISFGATPDALRSTIQAERDKRMHQPAVTTSPRRGERPPSVDLFNPRRLHEQ